MRIALSGYYGFDNAGDEALLSAITSSIKRLAPEAEFVVFSGHPERTALLHGITAVNYRSPIAVASELSKSDLLISGGGSIFQDVTSSRSLAYYISVVALAKFLNKPVIFYGQGIGPINRWFSKLLMRKIANKVDLITLRDEKSRLFLQNLGVTRPPMQVTSDPVFSLEAGGEEREEILVMLKENHIEKPLLGVSVRKWAALDGYQAELAKLLDDLSEDYQIILIPMAYPEDLAESEKILRLMKKEAFIVNRNLSSKELLALISELDLVIGMRLHSLIFAASCGIPFAGISYDPKVDAFLDLFGLQSLPPQYQEMKEAVSNLLNNTDIQDQIRQKALEMSQKADENARLALSLIDINLK